MNNSGESTLSFVVGLLFLIIVARPVYLVGSGIYHHFHDMEVHSSTVVSAHAGPFSYSRQYNDDKSVSNEAGADVTIPAGFAELSYGKRISLDRANFASDKLAGLAAKSSTVYAAKLGVASYEREYGPNSKLVSETLGAGVAWSTKAVGFELAKQWTFTKPKPKDDLWALRWRPGRGYEFESTKPKPACNRIGYASGLPGESAKKGGNRWILIPCKSER